MSDWVIDFTAPYDGSYYPTGRFTKKGRALQVTEFLLDAIYTGASKEEQSIIGEAVIDFLGNLDSSLENFYNDTYIELK